MDYVIYQFHPEALYHDLIMSSESGYNISLEKPKILLNANVCGLIYAKFLIKSPIYMIMKA